MEEKSGKEITVNINLDPTAICKAIENIEYLISRFEDAQDIRWDIEREEEKERQSVFEKHWLAKTVIASSAAAALAICIVKIIEFIF